MGDRALFGFRINNTDKLFYTKYRGFPEKLGISFLTYLRDTKTDKLYQYAQQLKIYTNENAQQLDQEYREKYLKKNEDLICQEDVCNNENKKCYRCYTSMCFIMPVFFQNTEYTFPYVENNIDWLSNSPILEYAYIANLDTKIFELYSGSPYLPRKGRYAYLKPVYDDRNFGIRLLDELPMEKVKKMQDYAIEKYVEDISKLENSYREKRKRNRFYLFL